MVCFNMAIGSYRDEPGEMSEAELAVAAAQYPEGGLVVGIGLGIVVSLLTVAVALAVVPLCCALLGYYLGTRVRDRKLRATR